VWLDGEELGDAGVSGNIVPGGAGIGRTSFGAGFFGAEAPQPAFDFWVDEIIVDARRVGCAG